MAGDDKKAISRIRTFSADVSDTRGETPVATPKLARTEATAQSKADAILKEPSTHVLPQKAKDLKRTKPKTSSEFLSANADIPPVESPAKKEEIAVTEKDVFSGMAEVAKPAPLPRTIKVPTTTQQKVKVADDTLADEVKTIQSKQATSTTLNEAPSNVSLQSDEREGVLIQNKKKKRFHILPAIGNSLQTWAKSKQTQLTQKKEPAHVVRKADTRIETIAHAARDSYHAPQSDHGVVVKRLAKKKRVTQDTALSVKEKDTTAPSWTYTTEKPSTAEKKPPPVTLPEPALIEPELETSTIDEELKEKVITTGTVHSAADFMEESVGHTTHTMSTKVAQEVRTNEEPQPAPKENEPITTTTETKDAVSREAVPVPSAPAEEVVVPKTPAPTQIPQPAKQVPIHTTQPVEPPVAPKKEVAEAPKQVPRTPSYAPSPTETASRVPIYIYIAVMLVASALGIGTSIYWFTSSTSTQEVLVQAIPSLARTSSQVPIPLSTDRGETYEEILAVSLQSRETIEIYPTQVDETGARVPADTQTILASLNLRAPGSFTRSISQMTFGSVSGTDPFILMRVGNFDTAFAGMLSWEEVMSEDLAPVFGGVVRESYDPYARTDSQIRSAFFRDTIISNKSARILVDANNEERIVYSFVQPNVILITTSSDVFTQLVPLVYR